MQVLSVASEIFPLVKTGGLADVTGALPKYLRRFGIHVKTLVPGYPGLMRAVKAMETVMHFDDLFGAPATLLQGRFGELDLLILHSAMLYERDGGPYIDALGNDHADNWKRFAALSAVAAEISAGLLPQWSPDLVHTHDWQSALTSVYMRHGRAPHVPSVLTVHNIAFQGQFHPSILPALGLPPQAYGIDCLEYHGDISFLKGGLQTATAITTVSPTYAREILSPEFGMGLQGVLNARANHLIGIVNGIDTAIWDPGTDAALPQRYDDLDLAPRAINRKHLQEEFGLDDDAGPVFAVVSRLTWQKGLDMLAAVVGDLVHRGGKLIVLGRGDRDIEERLTQTASQYPGRVSVRIGYDEQTAHLIHGGADCIVQPSRFEPCGLTQLYALRYGAVPVVSRTGGLSETIIDANDAAISARVATGFQFHPVNEEELKLALQRAIIAFQNPRLWSRLQHQGMRSHFSWERSAQHYADLYASILHDGNDAPVNPSRATG